LFCPGWSAKRGGLGLLQPTVGVAWALWCHLCVAG
jgi:hypothetical protein